MESWRISSLNGISKIESKLQKPLNTQTHFPKKSECRRAASSKTRPVLTRKTDFVQIHEYFRAAGACEAVQGLSDLFSFRLQDDDVQDFDVRWDQALLSASDMPSDVILEGLYKSKFREFCSNSDCVDFVRSRNGAKQGAELSPIEDRCKTSY